MRRGETLADWLARTDQQAADLEVREHVVYRAFDSYGLLLYIGCTANLKSRLSAHSGGPWHRYAETIATVAYPTRTEARAAETAAIESEAAYFNATRGEVGRTQANHLAAKRSLWRQGWYRPEVPAAIDPRRDQEVWNAAWEAIQPELEAWDRAVDREQARLKAGAFPFLTSNDRLARYAAAREDAELARLEAAA